MKNRKIVLFISVLYFFLFNLNLSIYSSFSYLRFPYSQQFCRTYRREYLYSCIYSFRCIYYIVYIPHNGTKIFFQFYALFRRFYLFFLIRIYCNAGILALPAASKRKFVGNEKVMS